MNTVRHCQPVVKGNSRAFRALTLSWWATKIRVFLAGTPSQPVRQVTPEPSMPTTAQDLDLTAINTIRTLAMDAVEAATCGHPGTPMALAPVSYQLWTQHLRYDPTAPHWPNRDRYVLSCGHASMLLYSLIHLAGIRHAKSDGHVTDQS